MKNTKKNLLSFYKNIAGEPPADFLSILTKAEAKAEGSLSAYGQLKKLGKGNEEYMLDVLRASLYYPAIQGLDKKQMDKKRKRDTDISKARDRTIKAAKKNIHIVRDISAFIDDHIHKSKTFQRVKLERHIESVVKTDKRPAGEKHFLANKTIFYIFLRCKQESHRTDNNTLSQIADFLTLLGIKNSRSKNYTAKSLRYIVNKFK